MFSGLPGGIWRRRMVLVFLLEGIFVGVRRESEVGRVFNRLIDRLR